MAWKCPEGRYAATIKIINMRIRPTGVIAVHVPDLNRFVLLNPRHCVVREPVVGQEVVFVCAAGRKWMEPRAVSTPQAA